MSDSKAALEVISSKCQRPVQQLVENRTLYEHHEVDFAIYDTYEPARAVALKADEILYCGMISGRKVLHADQFDGEFLPHESFVMAPGQQISIDFPDAAEHQPTSCMTLGIRREKLQQACDMLNHHAPLPPELGEWNLQQHHVLHTFHTEGTQQLLVRIVNSFLGADSDRDLVLKLGVTELLTRMLRQGGRDFLLGCANNNPTLSGITHVVHFIEQHLADNIEIEQLCKLACMSRSKLYQQFKHFAHCSPMEYILQRRLEKARQLLSQGQSVTRVCFDVGFAHPSHFTRRFHQQYGLSPSEFVRRQLGVSH